MAEKKKKDEKKKGYSGLTLKWIRRQKYYMSCVQLYMEDFDTIVAFEEFSETVKTTDGQMKPLAFMSVDGVSDKVPKQTMAAGICQFTLYDIEAILIFSHAPGSCEYNKVECRMAPLLK